MRRILCIVCIAFSFCSASCVSFLDTVRHDDGHISRMGGSAKARSIENDLDWGTQF